MAKGFRTFETIRGKEAMLRQIICEARYSDGHLYLDHCGRLLRNLLREMPEWVVAPEPTPKGATLHNLVAGTQIAFGRESASLSLDLTSTDAIITPEDVAEFLRQVEAVLVAVLDELEVTDFRRLGYREQYYFSFESKEESEAWLQSLGLVTISPSIGEAFLATPEALGVALVLQGEACRYRIGLNGIERSAQVSVGDTVLNVRASATSEKQRRVLIEALKQERQRQIASAYAVVLDVDAYLISPAGPDAPAFAREQSQAILPTFKKSLPEAPKKGK
jgi:hypothetical protein